MTLTIDALLEGYGDPEKGLVVTLEMLKAQKASPEDMNQMTAMDPMFARYSKITRPIINSSSLLQLTKDRLAVSIEYLIRIAEVMDDYQGEKSHQKIIGVKLTESQKDMLRYLPKTVGPDEQKQIEAIDGWIRHDLGATTDWLKIQLLTREELGLQDYADAPHCFLTSDDINSMAFGLMNTQILKKSVLPTILGLQEQLIEYACRYDSLVIAGLTHGQPAEFTTLSKRFLNITSALDETLQKFIPYNEQGEREPLLFPGKMGGAVGNLSDHRSAYPDIDWLVFFKELVESFDLKYKEMTDQCHNFVEYQHVSGLLNEICTTLEKFGDDLWLDIQNQNYNKLAKKGDKGSSVMAQKKNPWILEGGIEAMIKGAVQLQHTTKRLRSYHFEGDMGRSFLTRDIGGDYARIVLGISRLGRELSQYVPNEENIGRFMKDNPGLSTAPIMGVLKRAGVGGDVYRLMQSLSYDKETSQNRTRKEYVGRLRDLVATGIIPPELEPEIGALLEPENNLGYAREFNARAKQRCLDTVVKIKKLYKIQSNKSFEFKGG